MNENRRQVHQKLKSKLTVTMRQQSELKEEFG